MLFAIDYVFSPLNVRNFKCVSGIQRSQCQSTEALTGCVLLIQGTSTGSLSAVDLNFARFLFSFQFLFFYLFISKNIYLISPIKNYFFSFTAMEDYKFLFKVVLIGNAGVGKF